MISKPQVIPMVKEACPPFEEIYEEHCRFAQYLLPESRNSWEELNAFWEGERRSIGEV